ncbi:MAG: M42 family metallopeptidase [Christensenellales bacterium]
MSQAIETLKKLRDVYGPSGREDEIASVIMEEVRPYADKVYRDVLGNVIAVREPQRNGDLTRAGSLKGRKVMLAAHMDQIGYMVTHIDEQGFLRIANVGGLRPQRSLFQAVRFANHTAGVLAYETKQTKYDDIENAHLFVDIGAHSRQEAQSLVQIGDVCILDGAMKETSRCIIGPALDNRTGCAIVLETLRNLKDCPHTVFAVFTVQEEVGARGAKTAAFALSPDLAVAVDVTSCSDTPQAQWASSVNMGGGPAIKVKDNTVIAHPAVRAWLENTARQEGIPYQPEVLLGGGTDAGTISLSKEGIPAGALSLGTRYVHTAAETVSREDFENCIHLLLSALKQDIIL